MLEAQGEKDLLWSRLVGEFGRSGAPPRGEYRGRSPVIQSPHFEETPQVLRQEEMAFQEGLLSAGFPWASELGQGWEMGEEWQPTSSGLYLHIHKPPHTGWLDEAAPTVPSAAGRAGSVRWYLALRRGGPEASLTQPQALGLPGEEAKITS